MNHFMYVMFGVQDGAVAVEFDARVAGWSELANAMIFSLNKCADLTSKAQVVKDHGVNTTVITPVQMKEWFRHAGVPF